LILVELDPGRFISALDRCSNRYRRLGRNRLGNGNPPKLRTSPKKRAESQPSGARYVGRFLSRIVTILDINYGI